MDKKISELTAASAIDAADVSVLVHNTTDYQYTFATLLTFLGANLQLGAGVSFGMVLPQNTTGKNGDVFINTAAGSFAQKVSGTWMVVYTLPTTGSQADGTVLYGLGAPANSTGDNNDTYINTANGIFYKKTAGTWSLVFTMLNGPAGAKGDKGDKGDTGAGGRTILSGSANPSNTADGANGDYYINTGTYVLFGPKAAGVWGSGTSLVGPDGAKGDTGNTGTAGQAGAGVATGGITGQVLKKVSGSDFDTGWTNEQDITGKANIAYVDAADATLLAMIDSLSATLAADYLPDSGGAITGNLIIGGSLQSPDSGDTWQISADGTAVFNGNHIGANNVYVIDDITTNSLTASGSISADTLGIRSAEFDNANSQAVNIPNEGFIGFGGNDGATWYVGNISADGGLEISKSAQPAFIFKNGGVISRNTGGEVLFSGDIIYSDVKIHSPVSDPYTGAILSIENTSGTNTLGNAFVTLKSYGGDIAYLYQRNSGLAGFTSTNGFSVDIYGGSNSAAVFKNSGDIALGGIITDAATNAGAKVLINGSTGLMAVDGDLSANHVILPDEDTGLTYKLNVKSGALNLVLA